ncbi:hypothetical protein [Pseudonocardia nigra]|uniref:hypothetical protein n=1 Tax=Pseudonocardia nigra TaxID=1921578 RepID=UPI0027E29013|nr:hypothetical protein [Pseudonocardia nigra]
MVVLDGASAFVPVEVDPATYAQTLGAHIAARLDDDPAARLPGIVAASIRHTAAELDLTPGRSPSSTVSILRARTSTADLYVLGDSPIHYGTASTAHVLTDERLAGIAPTESQHYTARLRAGHGYDDGHRAALATLQRAQGTARNQPGGYWTAEAEPKAAFQGITCTLGPDAITWAVLATDGAADAVDHNGQNWSTIAHYDSDQLAQLLHRLHNWEADSDPDGRKLPRAKRHDDKTLAAVPSVW